MKRLLITALLLIAAVPAAAAAERIGTLKLRAPDGGEARGKLVVFDQGKQRVSFNLTGSGLAPNAEDEAYGVWLTGGGKPHFLGYAPQVGKDGELGVSGPQPDDAKAFVRWLTKAERVVVTVETEPNPAAPGEIALRGRISATSPG